MKLTDEALHEFIGVSLTFQCFFGYLKRAIQRSQLLRDEHLYQSWNAFIADLRSGIGRRDRHRVHSAGT